MKIPPFVKAKALLTMLPENVRNIMPLSELVTVTTIILNAMLRPGVSKTDIIQLPVPFHNMSMKLVRVTVLCIKVVKPTMTVPVKKPVLLKPVRQVRSSKRTPDDVLMILLTALAVRRQDVRLIHL